MDKLTISKEQEEALEEFMEHKSTTGRLATFIDCKGDFIGVFDCLDDFTPQQFALLLCGWYEVQNNFEYGEWIIHQDGKLGFLQVGEDVEFHDDGSGSTAGIHSINVFANDFRKATLDEIAQEKERRRWAEVGRERYDYRNGDIVTTGSITRTVKNVRGNRFDLEGAGEYFAEEVAMVCPVERRLDT